MDQRSGKMARRIIWGIVLLTLIPSIYFGYDVIQQNKFTKAANRFIDYEANFPNDYLLNRNIDAKAKSIILVFGGQEILPAEIEGLKRKMRPYGLEKATLEIKQGFAYLAEKENNIIPDKENEQLHLALELKDQEQKRIQHKLDSIEATQKTHKQVYAELKAQYPNLNNAIIQPSTIIRDSMKLEQSFLVLLNVKGRLPTSEKNKIQNWLKVRLQQDSLTLIFQ